VLPTLYLLGVVTFVRMVECGAEDFRYGLAINRIRGYYKQLAGDQANLFLLSGHDDGLGVFANAAVPVEGRTQLLTFGSVVAVINSVVGGSAVAIALGAFVDASLGVAAGVGGAVAIVSVLVLLRFADRLLDARTGGVRVPLAAGQRCLNQIRRGRDSNPRGSLTRPHDFQSCTFSRSVTSPARCAVSLEAQVAHARLAPAEVVGQLVAQRSLDLGAQQLRVVSEVALERVLVDDDPVGVVVARDGVAEVVAVRAVLCAELRHDASPISAPSMTLTRATSRRRR
jgi:hypothetical protein